MKTLTYFIIAIAIGSLGLSCTPVSAPADEAANKPEIFNTGDDQSVYPDNDRD